MLQAGEFTILTDHKSLTFAFQQNNGWSFCYLDDIRPCTTNIQTALSGVHYAKFAMFQPGDDELKILQQGNTVLPLEKFPVAGANCKVWRHVAPSDLQLVSLV